MPEATTDPSTMIVATAYQERNSKDDSKTNVDDESIAANQAQQQGGGKMTQELRNLKTSFAKDLNGR